MQHTNNIYYHKYDLPSNLQFNHSIAIDTEAMGLNNLRDRLCVVQISGGDGVAHLVHFPEANYTAPNLKRLLSDHNINKIFHFARFDVAILKHYLAISIENIFCTKIASRLSRTYTDSHGLKDLCFELLGVKISKQERSSDWSAESLTKQQLEYAAQDVLYLHKLRDILSKMVEKAGRTKVLQHCCDFIPTRAELDLAGWSNEDIFLH